MPDHLHEDHVGTGLNFDGSTLTATGSEALVYAGRYLDNTADSDQAASFIDADTNTNGAWTFSLRDADHAAGMHYWIRVDQGNNALTIQREGGSSKTISGTYAGLTLSGATSFDLFDTDRMVRLRPDGANWSIY